MTRIDVHIGRLVLHGFPAELAEGIGPLVELRLSELATADREGEEASFGAAPRKRGETVADRDGLAARIAHDVWTSTRAQLREERPR